MKCTPLLYIHFTILCDYFPGAQEPIVHAEQLQLFCSPLGSDPTSVLLNLDRGVYPIGSNMKLQAEVNKLAIFGNVFQG